MFVSMDENKVIKLLIIALLIPIVIIMWTLFIAIPVAINIYNQMHKTTSTNT